MITSLRLPDHAAGLRQYLGQVLSKLSNVLAHKSDSFLKYPQSYDNVLGNATYLRYKPLLVLHKGAFIFYA